MRRIQNLFAFFIWGILSLLPTVAPAQGKEEAGRTLSPYFFVQSEGAEVDSLPLKSTSVRVKVAGVIADVTVTQVYQNEGKKPLEAIYIFPASTRAAVYGMKMTIGARTLIAQVRERDRARREYEQAKEEGRSASLLEQQRPNVFQMRVANLLPGDIIQVELRYTELLVPNDGIYEFVYPTV
ncbi:MAG: VIT domain-containing protein, partial [candidate division NC10 bacterium]|nr:VIT domain-containing protein [candidate division NC10 bacterium]